MATNERPRNDAGWSGTLVGLLAVLLAAFAGDPFLGPRPAGLAAIAPRARGVVVTIADPDGHPLRGALVVVEAPGFLPLATDREGRALLRLPAGHFVVRTEATGLARRREEVTLVDGRAPPRLALRLAPETPVRGTIVGDDGQPIGGATVEAVLDADPSSPPFPGKVEPDGTFSIPNLPAEPFVVTAHGPGHGSESRLIDPVRDTATNLAFALERTGILVARIVDPDGNPGRRARVEIGGSGVYPAKQLVADDSGTLRWDGIPQGLYEARASLPGLASERRAGIQVESGRTTNVELRLAPAVTLVGRVVGDGDAPVVDAEVVVVEDVLDVIPRSTKTRADGGFELRDVPPRSVFVTVRAESYLPHGPESVVAGSAPLRIALERAATVRGRVVDADGEPVVGALVQLASARGPSSAPRAVAGGPAAAPTAAPAAGTSGPSAPLLRGSGELGVTVGAVPPIPLLAIAGAPLAVAPAQPRAMAALGAGTTVTDRKGEFVLVSVPPGTVQVAVQHPLYPTVLSEPRTVSPGHTIDDLVITLAVGGTIEGRVVDARGFPVPSIAVELRAEREGVPRTTTTARDGAFEFGGVIGTAFVTALPYGFPPVRARVEVEAGATVEVDLALDDALATLEGRVVDGRGFPIANAEVKVMSLRARSPFETTVLVGRDGTFHLDGLPRPPYRVEVDHPSYAPLRIGELAPRPGLELALAPGGTLVGRIVSSQTGAPLGDALVELLAGGSLRAEEATSDDGSFDFDRIAAGRYALRIRSRTHLGLVREVELSEGRGERPALDVGEIRLAAAGVIRGRVTDAVGQPVPGATVRLPYADAAPSATTNGRGEFEIRGVPPGTHELLGEHPEAGRGRSRAAVRVVALETTSDVEVPLSGRIGAGAGTASGGFVEGVAAAVEAKSDGLVLSWVGQGSAADAAGLRVGDYLVSIDGETPRSAGRANALLRGPQGVRAVVVLIRGGRDTRFLVARETYRR
ncbi:MAG: carboxypeptidase regulatory-like domain-containing protein [Polyangiales bacterium]